MHCSKAGKILVTGNARDILKDRFRFTEAKAEVLKEEVESIPIPGMAEGAKEHVASRPPGMYWLESEDYDPMDDRFWTGDTKRVHHDAMALGIEGAIQNPQWSADTINTCIRDWTRYISNKTKAAIEESGNQTTPVTRRAFSNLADHLQRKIRFG